MPHWRTYKAFFSYAHEDGIADPRLIDALTDELERRVNIKLVNERFKIWRDVDGLRAGDRWNEKIENALRESDFLIVLLTPRWIGSDYCRREYGIFEQIESSRVIDDYVAGYIIPILSRDVEKQRTNLTIEQKETFSRIASRQYQTTLATTFLALPRAERTIVLDKVADDVEGMIERRRVLSGRLEAPNANTDVSATAKSKSPEFNTNAHNYEHVDLLKSAEIVLGRRSGTHRDVLAQVEFVHRLYVQGRLGKIYFSIRRAILSLSGDKAIKLSKCEHLKKEEESPNTYYITLHEAPDAISVCIDPQQGRPSLAEISLPPTPGENYLSKVAITSAEATAEQLRAELIVSLNSEGLSVAEDATIRPSQRTINKIKAIMAVTAAKVAGAKDQVVDKHGRFRRKLSVRERS